MTKLRRAKWCKSEVGSAYANYKKDVNKIPDVDVDTDNARKNLRRMYGDDLVFEFGKIRSDGTRYVKFKKKGSHEWTSYSYLTDIR